MNPYKSLEKRNKLARASHLFDTFICHAYSCNNDGKGRPFDVWRGRGMDSFRKKVFCRLISLGKEIAGEKYTSSWRIMLENNVGGKNSISREVGKKNSYPNQITHTPPPPPPPPPPLQKWNGRPLNIPFATFIRGRECMTRNFPCPF